MARRDAARQRQAALPYHTVGRFAREQFGAPIFRVVVDAGCSCPVRDGTRGSDGCAFCSIEGFRPPTARPELSIAEQVARALPRLSARYPQAAGFLVYFQPYTNTHTTPERLEAMLAEASRIEGALGLVIGTRPDALPREILDVLCAAARRTWLQVELGVQSTHDPTLRALERRHDWATSCKAIHALRRRRLRVGAHMILATPWEPPLQQIEGARRLSAAGVDAVKLHHLQVLRGSRLAQTPPEGGWRLPDWRAYAELASSFLEGLDPRITVERLCAKAPPELLIAPRWEVDAATVRARICERLRSRKSRQGTLAPRFAG